MKNKLIFGNVVVVGMLVLMSFVSVVGYQLVNSANITEPSPLFIIRSNRAIGGDDKILDCRFICNDLILPFPKVDDKAVLVQNIIESIGRLDDIEFEKFILSVIDAVQNDNKLQRLKPDFIREACYHLRNMDKPVQVFNVDLKNMTFAAGFEGILSCILLPFILAVSLVIWCLNPAYTMIVTCPTMFCPRTLDRIF